MVSATGRSYGNHVGFGGGRSGWGVSSKGKHVGATVAVSIERDVEYTVVGERWGVWLSKIPIRKVVRRFVLGRSMHFE